MALTCSIETAQFCAVSSHWTSPRPRKTSTRAAHRTALHRYQQNLTAALREQLPPYLNLLEAYGREWAKRPSARGRDQDVLEDELIKLLDAMVPLIGKPDLYAGG